MPDQRTVTLASPPCLQSPDPPPRTLIRMRQRRASSGLDRQRRPAHIGQQHFPHSTRHNRANLSRGFPPWRFSDAGPRSMSHRRLGAGIRKPSQTEASKAGLAMSGPRPTADLSGQSRGGRRVLVADIRIAVTREPAYPAERRPACDPVFPLQTGDGGSGGHRVFRGQLCHRLEVFEPEYSYLDSEACRIAAWSIGQNGGGESLSALYRAERCRGLGLAFDDLVQQVGSNRRVGGLQPLILMMADPITRRHENHCGWSNRCDRAGVMHGAT